MGDGAERVRIPAVAGFFYPAGQRELRQQVQAFLADARPGAGTPKALIAPHAGYPYSGPVAGSAYALLADAASRIRRVVLLGPAHRLGFRGLAYCSANTFLTPLGPVPVDRNALASLADLPQVREYDAPFNGEHCLEVQLPFLQTLLRDFRLIPLLVGDADPEAVAQVLERLWGGDETLILISSDLSHYLSYPVAQRRDAVTTATIERLQLLPDPGQACGQHPINGLLLQAQRHHLTVRTLDQRNSGDTAGSRDRVVGYGAYAFFA